MNKERLKAAIRYACKQTHHTWLGWDGPRRVELVSLPLDTLNLLLKAAKKELGREPS